MPNLTPGYGSCEVCGAVNVLVYPALGVEDGITVHTFCGECTDSGAAIAHLEELCG